MDYEQLGLGQASSIVESVSINAWGNQVEVHCVYNPMHDAKPYMLLFNGCNKIIIDLTDESLSAEGAADLIGIAIGEGGYKQPAIITTDVNELHISYNTLSCILKQQP